MVAILNMTKIFCQESHTAREGGSSKAPDTDTELVLDLESMELNEPFHSSIPDTTALVYRYFAEWGLQKAMVMQIFF